MNKKEALEVVRKNYPHVGVSGSEFETALRELVPELNESEDERIRKELVYFIQKEKEYMESEVKPENSPKLMFLIDALAYLERQKEQKPSLRLVGDGLLSDPNTHFELESEQKPAEWSEEDKQKLNRIYEILGHAADDKGFLTSKRIIGDKEAVELQDFLKSLSERFDLQPKQEWSEEDIEIIDRICSNLEYLIKGAGCNSKPNKVLEERIKWMQRLKSLRPQPKAKLTLLDENIIKAAVAFVEQNDHFNCWGGIDKHTVIKALRSLKPHWKPSEKQMKALDAVYKTHYMSPTDKSTILNLLNDLKKLM